MVVAKRLSFSKARLQIDAIVGWSDQIAGRRVGGKVVIVGEYSVVGFGTLCEERGWRDLAVKCLSWR